MHVQFSNLLQLPAGCLQHEAIRRRKKLQLSLIYPCPRPTTVWLALGQSAALTGLSICGSSADRPSPAVRANEGPLCSWVIRSRKVGPMISEVCSIRKVANRGIGGDTTRGMLLRLEDDVLSLQPAAVVMLMGTNDLEENAEPKMIAANVELIIEHLKKHDSTMPIVLCQMFPSSAKRTDPKKKFRKPISCVSRRSKATLK